MADALPAKLKRLQLAPFAKRAAQLERFKPIVSYWLRFYMVQKVIAGGLHSADEECTVFTTNLMERLEQTKADTPNEDALLDDVVASAYCEQFALQTFAKGEKDMAENRATGNTADTLLAASTFLEILSIWKPDADPEITSKTKFAKYHALRILKAIKAGQDPNETNPAQETHQALDPPILDPSDPEVQNIIQTPQQQQPHNPYQPYVESAPDFSGQPSPAFTAPKVSPPANLPTVPTGYTQPSHNDVSPMSQTASSRNGSVASIGGGYFPRTDVPPPTFSAENTAPTLPTAPSMGDETMTTPMGGSSLTQTAGAPDPSSFYQNPVSPPPTAQPPQNPYMSPTYTTPAPQQPQPPPIFQSSPAPPHQQYSAPPPHQNPYAQPAAPPPTTSQGPFRNDEDSLREAKKHAKWAISAIDFDDANTAVKELRVALKALGAI
ncbi:DUF605-domain-containing protein [Dothidotthia symphoricarpi CBS 119687]|uniref:DUF605-domain-containing protein n=1 Tax=Dothidotthia symphoricarpi CBS 119687 TaxID=1392245 RepID=A0A6A6APL5_9PLEO|nr:DUF605-domain-containing protein [Dothidotthia symphoricarpi CBS 119687]KAF2132827.1 DUF605-domain-containing protein [Dothidotthia symphoricarpi CBS 119687]